MAERNEQQIIKRCPVGARVDALKELRQSQTVDEGDDEELTPAEREIVRQARALFLN